LSPAAEKGEIEVIGRRSRWSRGRLAVAAGSLALAGLVFLAWTGRAAAAIDAGDLHDAKRVAKSFHTPGEGDVGGSVKCPRRTRTLTGGAYWHLPGKEPSISDGSEELGSSGPIGGNKWYAHGRNRTEQRLTVVALCLPKRKLHGVHTEKLSLDPADADPVGSYLPCPSGTRALSGGAIWHPRGAPPKPSLSDHGLLASSTVTSDDRGWYADGTDNYIGDDQIFTISVRCLKASKLADTTLRDREILAVAHDETAGFAVRCKHKSRALTGGGYWHASGQGPDPDGNTGIFGGSNSLVEGGRAWFAEGFNFVSPDPTRNLTVQALCLKAG
jgi:hypothetical protein